MTGGELSLQTIAIIVLLEGLVQAFGQEPSISDNVDLPFAGMSMVIAFGLGMLVQLAASAAGVLLARAVPPAVRRPDAARGDGGRRRPPGRAP